MASINVSKDKSKLFLDFRFRNICVRKQAELKGCPVNCKRAQNLLDREQAEIMLGQFDYRATFPNSSKLQKLEATAQIFQSSVAKNPAKSAFASLWFEESKELWRKSYTVAVANTEMLFLVYSRVVPNLTQQDSSEANNLLLRILNHPHFH